MAEDLRSFFSTSGLSRREFVVTTIGAGFALAVQPARAEAIKTNTTGLVAGAVKIPVSDGQMPGYCARGARDFWRPRIHPGRLPPVRQARLSGGGTGAVRAAG